MSIYVGEYNYEELKNAAVKFDATQDEIDALGEWFERFGNEYWSGECYVVDEKEDLFLYPIYLVDEDDNAEVIGYTFRAADDRQIMKEKQEKVEEPKMKSYKEYGHSYIGESDLAGLFMVGFGEVDVEMKMLHFGHDDVYTAYVVDGEAEIGSHYKKVASFKHWLRIYDDSELTFSAYGREINIFRAGELGCIIQVIR